MKGDGNALFVSIPHAIISVREDVCRDDPFDNQCIVSKEVNDKLHSLSVSI